jgi:hypothetical protein
MEELTRIGERNRRILAAFLKEKGIYDEFVMNTKEHRKKGSCSSINNIFNAEDLTNLFSSFFIFVGAPYPSRLNVFDRYGYWNELSKLWSSYVYYQAYRKYENIW